MKRDIKTAFRDLARNRLSVLGFSEPRINALFWLCDYLGVSPNDLKSKELERLLALNYSVPGQWRSDPDFLETLGPVLVMQVNRFVVTAGERAVRNQPEMQAQVLACARQARDELTALIEQLGRAS